MDTGFCPTVAEVADFLNRHDLCVLSTRDHSTGWPHSATVAFSATPELEIIFGTSGESRKYSNLRQDCHMAMTVTDSERRLTVQFQGVARLLAAEEMADYEESHYRKLPGSLPFKDLPDQVWFAARPVWVRFSDCNPQPWVLTVFEFPENA